MVGANFRWTHSPSRLAWSGGWRSVFIHQMNRFYSSGDFGHDDSTYDESMITEPRIKVVSAEYTHVKTASRKTNIWK